MTFYDKFNPGEYTLRNFQHWTVLLRQKQITIGSAVIILKRESTSLADVDEKEMAEFPQVVHWYEMNCRSKFGAEKFNYYAAMMKDNYVHFHAFPRYPMEIDKFGILWKDEFWPKPITLVDVVTDDSVLKSILKVMLG